METQYTVSVSEGTLQLFHLKHGHSELVASTADAFSSAFWFIPEVKFVRDGSGAVTTMILGGGRITGVTFQKITR
jgi:hypothetical protein